MVWGSLYADCRKSLVRMCSDSRWACVPPCLQACSTTVWTCHRDQPLQSQMQNRDTTDGSSSPYMLVSSRTALHALTKSLRNNRKSIAIPSGLLSQIVCCPLFCFQIVGILSVVFSEWGPPGPTGLPALNLTGSWTSIWKWFWLTFLLFWRLWFQIFFVFFRDFFFLTFIAFWKLRF